MNVPEELAGRLAQAGARLGPFTGQVTWHDEVPSTSDVAARMAEHGAPEGTVVVANAQSSGRGRLGREWASPPGAGLYVSVILRPTARAVPLLTIGAGAALAEGIAAATGLAVRVKWPNDIFVGDRKLAGILAEAGVTAAGGSHVILGFGINILPAAFPPVIAARATSIEGELGRAVDRGLVLAECLAALAVRYGELQGASVEPVLDAWRARAAGMLGRQIEWESSGGVRRGVAENIDNTGALLVRTPGGPERIISGEVRWL